MRASVILLLLVIASAGMKLYCLEYNGIISPDAELYNYYSSEIIKGNGIPDDVAIIHNIGFSATLAGLFYVSDSNDMRLQQIYTVSLSLFLIPLMFLFLRNWFETKYSLIGASFIALDPRIIQNSILGVTDILYLVLFMASLVFLVKTRYCMAFLFAGFAAVVRLEGIVLLPILFLLSYNKNIPKYHGLIFLIPLVIIGIFFVYETGKDNVTTQIEKEGVFLTKAMDDKNNMENNMPLFKNKVINAFVYLGWFTFPMFVFFIPTSVYFLIKNKMIKPHILILCICITAFTGVWAYLDAYDTRYFFHTYPFLTLLCLLTWKRFFPVRNSFV